MSMSEEQLEKTGILKTMIKTVDHAEDTTLVERMEVFEERLEYLNMSDAKKNKLKKLVKEIKEEDDLQVQEFLFKQLVKEVDNN